MDYLESQLNQNEINEMKSEFYETHGMTYEEYLEMLEFQYADSKEER